MKPETEAIPRAEAASDYFLCSSDPGAADGSGLCAASEGAAENVFTGVSLNSAVCTVCTPTEQCTVSQGWC